MHVSKTGQKVCKNAKQTDQNSLNNGLQLDKPLYLCAMGFSKMTTIKKILLL